MEPRFVFCGSCGSAVEPDARFCGRCGWAVPPDDPGNGRRGSLAWLWVSLGLLVATGLVVGVFLLVSSGEDRAASPRTTISRDSSQGGQFSSSGDGSDGEQAPSDPFGSSTSLEATTTTTEYRESTTAAWTTTSAATTTMAATTTTHLVPPAGTHQPDLNDVVPGSLQGSAGAAGSGCMAGSDPLWDGVWFGYVEDRPSGSVVFDLACFYYGPIAAIEGAKDGITVGGDVYVRNKVALTWELPFHLEAVVYTLDPTEPSGYQAMYDDWWPYQSPGVLSCPGTSCGVWVYLNQGVITALVEYEA